MKNKHLVLFVVFAAAALFGLRHLEWLPKRTPSGSILPIDTARTTAFSLLFLSKDSLERAWIRMSKNHWALTESGRTVALRHGAVSDFFQLFEGAKIQRIASRDRADWPRFGLSDSTAARLEFFDGTRSLGACFLGGAQKNRSGPVVSFARLPTGDEVFELSGAPIEWLCSHSSALREDRLLRFEPQNVIGLVFQAQNQPSVSVLRGESAWQLAASGAAIDSAQIERVFEALKTTERGLPFADDFDEMKKSGSFSCSLMSSSSRPGQSFELRGWRPKGEARFALWSSQNQGSFFWAPDSLARRIFSPPAR